jgi:hypothetical protein
LPQDRVRRRAYFFKLSRQRTRYSEQVIHPYLAA